MNNMVDNNEQYKSEYVRPPMEYKTETLAGYTLPQKTTIKNRYNTHKTHEEDIANEILDKDTENAIMDSIIEFEQIELEKEWARNIEEQIRKEEDDRLMEEAMKMEEDEKRRKELLSKFSNIQNQIKRISRLDKDIQKLNYILVEIIDTYCEDSSQVFSFDAETYNMIITNIKSIRLKPEDIEFIHSIIKKDE